MLVLFNGFGILFYVESTLNTQRNYQPQTLAEANQIIVLLQEKVRTIEQQYETLQQQIINLLRGKYGKKSEKLPEGYMQLSLFGDNQPLEQSVEQIPEETISYTRKKRNGHRNIPDNLPRVRIEYKLEDLNCPCGCGNQLRKIDEVISEQLEIVPALNNM